VILRAALRQWTVPGAAAVLLAVFLCAVFAPALAPRDPDEQDLTARLLPPAWLAGGVAEYPLGTDALGRDLLSRIIFGARVSMLVGFAAVAVQAGVGCLLGLVSGYVGGRTDAVFMRIADVQLAIPFLVLAIAVMAVLGAGLRNVILVLGISGWVIYGRVIRSEVLTIRVNEYIEAARALGSGSARIMFRHILPNVVSSLLVISTLEVARMIIAEASLSYLGLGVLPPTPTWGGMVSDGRDWIMTSWWVSTLPGAAIFITVLSVNVVGDFLRDRFDPRLRNLS
jgi:peptide/nickel transport system permease protein